MSVLVLFFHSVPSPNYSQLHNSVLETSETFHVALPQLSPSLTQVRVSWNALTSEEGERSSARAQVSARALRSDARTTTCLVLVGQRASFIDKNNSERTFEDVRERIVRVASRKIREGS
ncbi:hypothetical protein QQF64_022746 [Cirrhinus molitorella]|uniref:Uncharacterized protein n=1 Tax=Cirrhinus molitorella TaxID=172907 RepID=A0ABR3L386_9TELE